MKNLILSELFLSFFLPVQAQREIEGDMNHDGVLSIVDIAILSERVLNFDPEQYQVQGTTEVLESSGRTQCNWVQLWENGPKWAEFNVGSTKNDYNTKNSYDQAYVGGYYTYGGYVCGDCNYSVTDKLSLSGNDDTATKLWGDKWRMPTYNELRGLESFCDWTYVSIPSSSSNTESFVAGYRITGRGEYADKSIFLPAVGEFRNGVFESPSSYSPGGMYRTRDSESAYATWCLNIGELGKTLYRMPGNYGYSIRAVRNTKPSQKSESYNEGDIVNIEGREGIVVDMGAPAGKIAIATRNLAQDGSQCEKVTDYGGYFIAYKASEAFSQGKYGNGWMMIDYNFIEKLKNKPHNWTTVNGVNGIKWSLGSNYLFLPAAGYCSSYYSSTVSNQGTSGYYLSDDSGFRTIDFSSSSFCEGTPNGKLSVRPVHSLDY